MKQWRIFLSTAIFACVALVASVHLSLTQTAQSDEELKRSAERMAEVARTTFTPVYPTLTKQIVEDTGVREGIFVEPCPTGIADRTRMKAEVRHTKALSCQQTSSSLTGM